MRGGVVVEVDCAVGVDVEGADDEVGEGDVLLGDEREEGDGAAGWIVRCLVVEDEAGEFGAWLACLCSGEWDG